MISIWSFDSVEEFCHHYAAGAVSQRASACFMLLRSGVQDVMDSVGSKRKENRQNWLFGGRTTSTRNSKKATTGFINISIYKITGDAKLYFLFTSIKRSWLKRIILIFLCCFNSWTGDCIDHIEYGPTVSINNEYQDHQTVVVICQSNIKNVMYIGEVHICRLFL